MILAINFAKTFSCRKIAWLWEVVGKLERQLGMILLSHFFYVKVRKMFSYEFIWTLGMFVFLILLLDLFAKFFKASTLFFVDGCVEKSLSCL